MLGLVALVAAGCGGRKAPPAAGPQSAALPSGKVKIGQPYKINGKWYYPAYDPDYHRTGTASWYGAQFHGLATANGEVFDKETVSAAHPTLPLPSLVRVTNLENGRELVVRVNDRGPFVDDRLIDLSQAAARELGFERKGLARVKVEFLGIADGYPEPATAVAAAEPTRPAEPAPPIRTAAVASPHAPMPEPAHAARPTPMPPPIQLPEREPEPRAGIVLASLDQGSVPALCPAGPQFVQVGAFADTSRVRLAEELLSALQPVRTEPVFIGQQAALRVRLGPMPDRDAADRLLARVRAAGYPDAFLVPVQQGRSDRAC
jgi:rare lipoprotein A